MSGRVLDEPDTCSECDEDAVRGGLCPKHWREFNGDLLQDGGRTFDDFDNLTDADGVERPRWADGLDVGDAVRYDSPIGVLEGQIVGFSTKRGLTGQPAIELPADLDDRFPDGTQLIVLREEDLVAGKDLAPDGGEPTHHHLVIHPGDQFDDPEDWRDRLLANGPWADFFDSNASAADVDDIDAQALVDELEDDGFATDGGYVEWIDLSEPRRDILLGIALDEGASGPDVRKTIAGWRGKAVQQAAFSRLVTDLEFQELVESTRNGRTKHYRLTDGARERLFDRLQEHAELVGAEVDLSAEATEMVTDGGTPKTVNVNGELLTRQICPCCWEPGVVPVWEPVRGFLRCVECGANQTDDEWPDDYRYPEWRRRARTPRTQEQFVADGAGQYPCDLCGEPHDTLGGAVQCCSDDPVFATDGGFDSLLDVDIDEEAGCAVLRLSAERHGWSVETLVENSREYLKDGVESTTTQANCFVHEPGDLRDLAQELWSAADAIESAVATDGGTDRGYAPDDRTIADISAVNECDSCGWSPAAIVLVDGDWECYNCGSDPDQDDDVASDGGRLYDCPDCGTVEDVVQEDSDKGDFSVTRCADCGSRVVLTDGGQDLVNLLRELGLTERQIGIFQNEPDSLHDVFDQLDLHGELRLEDLEFEVDYSETTVHNALDTLVRGYGIVGSRSDPDDGRKKIYYLDEPEEQELRPDGGTTRPFRSDWPFEAVVHGVDGVYGGCVAITGSGKACPNNAYNGPFCGMHDDVDDPDVVEGAHQWARIEDGDDVIAVCVNCEAVWAGGPAPLAVGCPTCGADVGERCGTEDSVYSQGGKKAPVRPHPERRRIAWVDVDGFNPCLDAPFSIVDDEPLVLLDDPDDEDWSHWACPICRHSIADWTDCPGCGWYDEEIWVLTVGESEHAAATDGGEGVDVFLDDEETIDPARTFKKKATCPHPPDAVEAVEVEEIGETIWVCSECGHKLDGWEREERELSSDGGWNRRREVPVVEDEARFGVKATAVDQHGDHVENDELTVDAPKGGQVVLASIERGFLDALVVSNVGPDPDSSIDGDELDDEGTNCAQCGGTIVTDKCVITEDDFSKVRTCSDCGAHGVRYGIFGVNIERTAGPVYDVSLGPSFLDWCRDQGLIDRD